MGDFGRERRDVNVLTVTEAAARALSLGFYLVAARVLTVSDFGVVRYTISLALLALSPVLVLATATNRELGASRAGEAETRVILGSSLAIACWTWLGTAALCVAASAAGLTGSANLAGMLVVLSGQAMFSLNYQISRGLGRIKRITVTYVGASLFQLALLLALAGTIDLTPTVALIIFGVSPAVLIVAAELVAPVVRGRAVSFGREGARVLWKIGAPLLVAQAGFMIWFSADQIWVDSTLGSAQVGLYGAAKTLIQAFFVLTAGSMGVVLPRVAELRSAGHDERARHLIVATIVRLALLSLLGATILIVARSPLLTLVFGGSYDAAGASLIALAVSMTGYVISSPRMRRYHQSRCLRSASRLPRCPRSRCSSAPAEPRSPLPDGQTRSPSASA